MNTYHHKEGNLFLTSDSHYGHNKDWLYKPRGFSTREEHMQFLLDQYSSLKPEDTLVHLGDWFLTCQQEEAQELLDSIKCNVVTCLGNHNAHIKQLVDAATPEEFKGCQITPLKLRDNITLMSDIFVLKLSNRKKYWCSHFAPYTWDKMHLNELPPALCGHSHGSLSGAQPSETNRGKLLDVGVENSLKYDDKAFFTIEEVDLIMENKPNLSYDHH